jgi:hypothetical protein
LPFARSGTGAALIRQFAILSLIVIAAITIGLSLIIAHYLRKDLLEREWGLTADYIRAEAYNQLTPGDFATPMTSAAQARFETFYRQTVSMPEIVRVKIYDADMTVVWSDERRLVGQRFTDNRHLHGALGGRTTVNIQTDGGTGENVYESTRFPYLVELYVPIVFPGTSDVSGVVETYKVPAQVFANIRKGWMTVLLASAAGGAVLYVSLFWTLRSEPRA